MASVFTINQSIVSEQRSINQSIGNNNQQQTLGQLALQFLGVASGEGGTTGVCGLRAAVGTCCTHAVRPELDTSFPPSATVAEKSRERCSCRLLVVLALADDRAQIQHAERMKGRGPLALGGDEEQLGVEFPIDWQECASNETHRQFNPNQLISEPSLLQWILVLILVLVPGLALAGG